MTSPTQQRLGLHTVRVERIADDVVELTLSDPDGRALPPWEPGAHIDLRLPSGLSRQYSLCGDPASDSTYTVAVLHDRNGRGGSRELHEIACTGASFSVRVPKNDFPLVASEHYLFIAGGIGITPLLPMIDEVDRQRKDWSLVYGGRSRTSMAYLDRLLRKGARVDPWVESERGYPDIPALLGSAPTGTVVYTCGPGALIDAVASEFARHDHLGDLHYERFTAGGPVDATGASFEVELRRTGVTFTVDEDQTILGEVKRVLPDHPYSCEEGYCGECETGVIEGEPDHRDDYLTEEEQELGRVMMICVGRCKGARLVLDL